MFRLDSSVKSRLDDTVAFLDPSSFNSTLIRRQSKLLYPCYNLPHLRLRLFLFLHFLLLLIILSDSPLNLHLPPLPNTLETRISFFLPIIPNTGPADGHVYIDGIRRPLGRIPARDGVGAVFDDTELWKGGGGDRGDDLELWFRREEYRRGMLVDEFGEFGVGEEEAWGEEWVEGCEVDEVGGEERGVVVQVENV